MGMRIAEGLFTIATVALILTHSTDFTTLVIGAGQNYVSLVTGLQMRDLYGRNPH